MEKKAAKKTDKPSKKSFRFFHSGGLDVIFCCFVLLLFGVGLTMMYSASYAYAAANAPSPSYYFVRQLVFGIVGIIGMFFVSKVDYRILNGPLTIALTAFVIFLMFVAVIKGGGDGINRWIDLGFIQFQPSEFMKFITVLVMSYMLCILYETLRVGKNKSATPKRARLTKGEKFLYYFIDTPMKASFVLLFVCGIFTLLVLMGKHLSGAIIVCLVGLSMMWVGGANKKFMAFIAALGVLAVVLVIMKPEILKLFSDYACERVQVWKAKQTVGNTTYWQTKQGLYAIGSGGPFGVGFGNSKQKLLYVPEPQNDFVFSICCEELGYVGAILILLLFAAMIARGFMIAAKTTDYFGSLLVVGIMMQIGIQVVLNIAVVTDTIPNTGVPLPFFSYGGTALVMLFLQMGVVLSVSRKSYLDKD
ncbi:MAG: FtsW/RodA/SpoVE family cell cycle protein [Acutalibacteraceae bacterium]